MKQSFFGGVCAVVAVLSAAQSAKAVEGRIVVLAGLDKVTARVTEFEVPVMSSAKFGTFTVTARVCDKNPPEEMPETSAFLEIIDHRLGQDPKEVFSGWMFASSPGLSAVSHPVYDVWVTDCYTPKPSPPLENSVSPEETPKPADPTE